MSKLSILDIQIVISAVKIKKRKIFLCKNVYPDLVAQVPSFQLTARSSSFFCAFFLLFYGVTFFGTPNIKKKTLRDSSIKLKTPLSPCLILLKTCSVNCPDNYRNVQ